MKRWEKGFGLAALFALVLTLLATGCSNEAAVKAVQDAQGRTYTYVADDPVQARTYRLANGLTVMLARNDREPRIRSLIAVRAGSADDPARSTGLAHYFEHMMFKGNAQLGALDWEKEQPLLEELAALFEQHRQETDPEKRAAIYREIDRVSLAAAPLGNDEYWQLCRAIGAQGTNAWTSFDETVYINDIPSEALEKFLRLESCRFSGIALRRFHTELEAVYEEFNLSQDSDETMAFWTLMRCLFPHHAYGRMILGLPEHLKAPSMNDIHGFFRRFYRPSQMAVILVGDLDFDRTIELVECTFGALPEPPPEPPEASCRVPEPPLAEDRIVEIAGPENESATVAWRFENTPENRAMLTMIHMILQNGECGLFDTDLTRPGRVRSVDSTVLRLRDYLLFGCSVEPKEKQTLEEARDLVLAEIGKLASGDFPAWLPKASAANARLLMLVAGDERGEAAGMLKIRFIRNVGAEDALAEIAALERITPEEVAAFAAAHCRTGGVTVYKRRGEAAHKVHAEKPPITPVAVPEALSPFAEDWLALAEGTPPEPVFIDYRARLPRTEIAPGVGFYAVKNERNERFSFAYSVETGSLGDRKLTAALALLDRIGAAGMTADELRAEFYKLAVSLDISVSPFRTSVGISGLQRNAPAAIALFLRALNEAEVTQEALNVLVDETLLRRENRRRDPDELFHFANQYALYQGRANYACDEMPESELRSLTPAELQTRLRGYLSLPGDFRYYGPAEPEAILPLVPRRAATALLPPERHYRIEPPAHDTVYIVDYPNAGVKAALLRPDGLFAEPPLTFAALYGRYASRSFFSDLREKRAMAYAVSGGYAVPTIDPDNWSLFQAYIATSPDKLAEAMKRIAELQLSPPEDRRLFESARSAELSRIRHFRAHPATWYGRMKELERLHRQEPAEATLWREVPQVSFEGFLAECRRRADGKPAVWVVLGDRKRLDEEALRAFGEVKVLTPDDIFPGAER